MSALDKRLYAHREDLADIGLKGEVEAQNFVAPEACYINTHFADIHRAPDETSGLDTQFLYGTPVKVFEISGEWAWVQSTLDDYVGYTKRTHLSQATHEATHRVTAPRTFIYPLPDLKSPRSGYLSMGSTVSVQSHQETRGTRYAILDDGRSIIASHISPISSHEADYVTVAERLLHTPYLWGGTTGFGIDCSGLVQLSLNLAGHHALRDTDMQEASLGTILDVAPESLIRGDLVFWKGHVAIVSGANQIIHANGHSMNVAMEALDEAIDRIAYLYEKPTCFKRIAPIG